MKAAIRENIHDMPIPPGYDAVGAYVWDVALSPGERRFVLTNDPVPDGDFKMIIDHHRKQIAKKTGVPVENVQVLETHLVGFAQGSARHERSIPPMLDMEDGRVLISPEFAEQLNGWATKLEKYDAGQAEFSKNVKANIDASTIHRAGEIFDAVGELHVRGTAPLTATEKRPGMVLFYIPGNKYEKFSAGEWQPIEFKDITSGTVFRFSYGEGDTQRFSSYNYVALGTARSSNGDVAVEVEERIPIK